MPPRAEPSSAKVWFFTAEFIVAAMDIRYEPASVAYAIGGGFERCGE